MTMRVTDYGVTFDNGSSIHCSKIGEELFAEVRRLHAELSRAESAVWSALPAEIREKVEGYDPDKTIRH